MKTLKPSQPANRFDLLTKAERGAWARVSAYVVIRAIDQRIGIVKFAYPVDGASRLRVFAWDCSSTGLQTASANGYGYDKKSAAMSEILWDGLEIKDSGQGWESQLRAHGYTVIQAI